jgi:hypothetical protein
VLLLSGIYRQLYQHCNEPLESIPWLWLITLLGLGFVKLHVYGGSQGGAQAQVVWIHLDIDVCQDVFVTYILFLF